MSGCGSGGCGCAGTPEPAKLLTPEQQAQFEALAASVAAPAAPAAQPQGPVARVNGVALHAAGDLLDEQSLRQRACT